MSRIDQIGDAVQTRGGLNFEWIIRDFFSLSEKSLSFYVSPNFSYADTQWCLHLYPLNIPGQDWVGLYLSREESGPPKTMNFTLGIKISDGVTEKKDFKYMFSKKDEGYGSHEFVLRSDLKNRKTILMPDNLLTIICDLRSDDLSAVKDAPPVSTDQAVQAVVVGERKVLKSLLSMLESGEDSDVVIKVQGKEFPAHKNILRARSTVFRSMFEHEMVEKNSRVVNIEDCDPGTFPDFLIHMYSGSCALSTENVCSLYMAADKYDVVDLKEPCSEFMKRNITVECFCDVITLAVKHNNKDLTECATNFFCNNSLDIVKTTAWQTFLAENSTIGNELFVKAVSNYVTLLNISKK